MIALGTLLLKLPFATTDSITWMDALFTATSSFTVTGLAIVDIGTSFTHFGQLIILLLIKLGGIGIVTFAILAFMMLGKKIGMKERIMIQQTLNQESLGGILKLVRRIFIHSLTIELVATLILALRWVPRYGMSTGLYYSFFHAVSAFNNAGISLFSNGLDVYMIDPIVSLVMTTLFIMGGIGFTVLIDLKDKKKFSRLSLHSKVMIIGTLVLNVVAMLLFLVLETSNPETLGAMHAVDDQILAAYFQATTARTAGFSTVSISGFRTPTVIFMSILMFIGSGSASTAGGIKLTTFIVVVLSTLTFIRGKKEVTIGHRTLRERVIIRAFTILTLSFLFIVLSLFILTITESIPTAHLFFEIMSAFSTVGLSMGVTAELSFVGRCLMMILMFFGKIGPLTLAFSLANPTPEKIRYPNEDLLTG